MKITALLKLLCSVEDAGSVDLTTNAPVIETANESTTVKNAVDEAVKKLTGKEEPKEKEKVEKVEPKVEEDDNDDLEDEDALTEEESKYAAQLFKALKDPQKGPIVLEAMAKEAGLNKTSTVKEKEAVVDTIESILEKHLGADFPTLAKILTPAIKEAVQLETEAKLKGVRASVQAREDSEQRIAIERAQSEAFGRYENADTDVKLLQEISKQMDLLKPAKGMNAVSYFNSLIITAADNLGIELKRKGKEDKTTKVVTPSLDARRERNRNDARANLAANEKTTIGKEGQSKNDAKPTSIRDAVDLAMQQIQGKSK